MRAPVCWRPTTLPPTERGSHVGEDSLDHVGVVVDAELVGDGQEQGVGFGNSLVLSQLLRQRVGFVGVTAAEDCPSVGLDEAELVPVLSATAEIRAVAVVDEGENA